MTNVFSQSTQVERISPTTHKLHISDLWNVGKIPNGGYLMAHAALAMVEQVPHPHPIAVTGYYLDKSDNAEAQIASEVLRSGKSISTVSASLIQAQSERIRFIAAFSDLEKTRGENYIEAPAPKIAAFEQCVDIAQVAPMLKMYEQLNIRFDPASTGWLAGKFCDTAEMSAWLEFRDQSPFDVFSLLMIPDMLPPVIFTRFGASGWVPTIEMTVNVRAIPKCSRLQIRGKTRYMTDGLLEEDIEVWSDTGEILALSRQLAKLRMIEKT